MPSALFTPSRILLDQVDAIRVLERSIQPHNVGMQQRGVDVDLAGHLKKGARGAAQGGCG
jgi:hypothetical protein